VFGDEGITLLTGMPQLEVLSLYSMLTGGAKTKDHGGNMSFKRLEYTVETQ
jgi:hypothetical protein